MDTPKQKCMEPTEYTVLSARYPSAHREVQELELVRLVEDRLPNRPARVEEAQHLARGSGFVEGWSW